MELLNQILENKQYTIETRKLLLNSLELVSDETLMFLTQTLYIEDFRNWILAHFQLSKLDYETRDSYLLNWRKNLLSEALTKEITEKNKQNEI